MLFAVDQGASKTQALLLTEDGSILSAATTGGACYFAVGVETAFQALLEAAEQVTSLAGKSLSDITSVYAGMAGANWPDEFAMLHEEWKKRFHVEHVTVSNDSIIALRAGSGRENGIVLCAGSAFNCAVQVDGRAEEVLNNYVEGNDQGGTALGDRTLQAVFESRLGIREETVLTGRLLEYFGYDDVTALLLGRDRKTLRHQRRTVVPILLKAAEENDRVALDVVSEFSRSVSRYATSSLRRYGLVGKDCDVVLSGGVFKAETPLFFETIASEVHCVSQQARVVNAEFEPVVGAALLGLREIGAAPSALERCVQDARSMNLGRFPAMGNGA